ncbi:MAG: DUF896 domain-containing protein [Peptococcaceae bacterium]|nr:DUF896 domain-containing protein [Peptococcaceae bacterium]
MINKEKIERINWLSQKQRSEGLTAPEKEEQKLLRQQYLTHIKNQVVETFSNMGLEPSEKNRHRQSCKCSGCKKH